MKTSFHGWFFFTAIAAFLCQFALAEHKCNSNSQCPESAPCCSQYGTCGTGSYCLGGCDVRYSYNLTACMPQPRMHSFNTTFDDKKKLRKYTEYLGNQSETDWVYTGDYAIHNDAVLMQMRNNSGGTVISSTSYLWYGKVNARLKTSHDGGVITAFILFSDVQDEIDFEYLGYNLTAPQTNFYALGVTDYTHARNSSTSDTFENYHDYTIDWQEDKIDWYVDGEKVRTLEKESTWNKTAKRHDYPQTPSRIQFSLWPGGAATNGLGTIEWAGGAINWNSEDIQKYGYYYAYVKSVSVEAYDLPDDVKLEGDDDESKLGAFLYNNTKGWDSDVYLTNKKTWLGNDEATGFDPDNDDDDDHDDTTTVVEGSGSSKKTQVKTATKAANTNVPHAATTTKSDDSYDTAGGIGGFVQDSKKSGTTGSSDGYTLKSSLKPLAVVAVAMAAGAAAIAM